MVTCPWPLSNSFLGIGLVKATRGMTDGVTDENAHRGGLGLFGRAHGMMGFGNNAPGVGLSVCLRRNTSLFGDRQNSIHGGLTNAQLAGNTCFGGTLGGEP